MMLCCVILSESTGGHPAIKYKSENNLLANGTMDGGRFVLSVRQICHLKDDLTMGIVDGSSPQSPNVPPNDYLFCSFYFFPVFIERNASPFQPISGDNLRKKTSAPESILMVESFP